MKYNDITKELIADVGMTLKSGNTLAKRAMPVHDVNVWIEITDEEAEAIKTHEYPYDEIIEQKIRQRYTISAEFAISRQKDKKPTEYAEYYAYCEQCKQEAKAELGIG